MRTYEELLSNIATRAVCEWMNAHGKQEPSTKSTDSRERDLALFLEAKRQ